MGPRGKSKEGSINNSDAFPLSADVWGQSGPGEGAGGL